MYKCSKSQSLAFEFKAPCFTLALLLFFSALFLFVNDAAFRNQLLTCKVAFLL